MSGDRIAVGALQTWRPDRPSRPVTANGEVALTINNEPQARFHLVEKKHTYTSTTTAGGTGHDQNAPLQSIDLVWEPIGRCS